MEIERLEKKSRREVYEDEVRQDLVKITEEFERSRGKLSDEELQELMLTLSNIKLSLRKE